jgi:hypothetical protein
MFVPKQRSTVLISLFWLALLSIVFSNAGVNFLIAIPIYLVFGLWVFSWIIRSIVAIVCLIISWRNPNKEELDRQQLFNGGFESSLLVLSIALVGLQIPLSIRLMLSEPSLTQYVRDVRTNHKTERNVKKIASPDRWIGLFKVKETELLDDNIVRIITANDFFDDAGFVYSPDRKPPTIGEDSYRHLYGSWWYWSRSW